MAETPLLFDWVGCFALLCLALVGMMEMPQDEH
jgi:hypothetical protein